MSEAHAGTGAGLDSFTGSGFASAISLSFPADLMENLLGRLTKRKEQAWFPDMI